MRTQASANRGNVFVSFWDICLSNLPEGSFTHFPIAADRAKLCIDHARQESRLIGVSGDDLLAPYHQRERANHDQLCGVLNEHFGISLSLRDFVSQHDNDGQAGCSINSLNCVQLSEQDQLLVVTCAYKWKGSRHDGQFESTIEPTTVTFHLIEPTQNRRRREVLATKDFTEADLEAIQKAEPPAEAAAFAHEVTN